MDSAGSMYWHIQELEKNNENLLAIVQHQQTMIKNMQPVVLKYQELSNPLLSGSLRYEITEEVMIEYLGFVPSKGLKIFNFYKWLNSKKEARNE